MDERANRPDTIIIIDPDAVDRAALAAYLRTCGLRVFEASDISEAKFIVAKHHGVIELILCDAGSLGTQASFHFVHWVRQEYPFLKVLLAGTQKTAKNIAADICHDGPIVGKPYDHGLVIDIIRRNQRGKTREPAT